jgi:hypothetical protein
LLKKSIILLLATLILAQSGFGFASLNLCQYINFLYQTKSLNSSTYTAQTITLSKKIYNQAPKKNNTEIKLQNSWYDYQIISHTPTHITLKAKKDFLESHIDEYKKQSSKQKTPEKISKILKNLYIAYYQILTINSSKHLNLKVYTNTTLATLSNVYFQVPCPPPNSI